MRCPRCQYPSRAGAKFCEQCAAPLTRFCAQCGGSLPDAAKFCPACAHPITATGARTAAPETYVVVPTEPLFTPNPAPEGDRRQATVLFADISEYTTLVNTMDAEHVQALLGRFYELTDRIIAAFGGHVIDHAGDGVMGVFGAPMAYGNDAERAVRAALDLHAAAETLVDGSGQPLKLHIGMASGEVVAAIISGGAHAKYAVTGDTVNLASRLDGLASAGETFISDALHRAVSRVVDAEPLGDRVVKGFDRPVSVWKVRALRPSAGERRPFVGRQAEMRQLISALETTLETRTGSTVLVRGEPGIGKSRLAEELRRASQARGYACHVGNVLDFGVGKGQDPIPVILKGILRVRTPADAASRRLAVEQGLESGLIDAEHEVFINDLLDLEQRAELRIAYDAMDNATRLHRTGEAVIALVKRAAVAQPTLLLAEDIHWASPALLRYLALLTMAAAQCALVLVMTSRIEGDPLDRVWRASTHGSPLMTIDLGPLRAEEARIMAGELLETSTRIALNCVERAEGNPLFLEQLLRNAQESENATIPPTIQSLVLARMDRLGLRDRQALQAASVIGNRFSLEALGFLIDDPAYRCDALLAADLARPEVGGYLFAHALIQEGVYSSLLNSRKRELHRRAADWFGDREPILRAEHLDRAEDPAASQAYLDAAFDQARRFRYDTALPLAERGATLAMAGPTRYGLALLRGELLREMGRSQDSLVAFREALDLADDDGKRCRAWMGIAEGNRVTGEFALAMDALDQAEPIAQRLGLDVERSRIRHTRGNLFFAQGNVAACRGEHEVALQFAQQAKDPECEALALSGLGDAQYAQGRMLTALDYFLRCVELCEKHGLARVEVPNRSMVGHCLHYQNDLDGAVSELSIACEVARRVGLVQGEILAQESLGFLLVARGEYKKAESALTRSLSLARSAGARRYQCADLYYLALIRIHQDRRDQAREHLAEALELARQTGMGFMGAAIFGGIARATEKTEERRLALQDGESQLRQDCVGHSYFWFYRDAIDATLAAGEWDEALRFADALEDYARPEPLPWANLTVARCQALAAVGKHGPDAATLSELKRLREEAHKAGLGSALPAIDAVLAAG